MSKQLYKWLRISCFMHFVITFPMNMIYWISESSPTIMKFNHNLIIFLLSFIISAIICIFTYKEKPKQLKKPMLAIYNATILYTFISFAVRLFAKIAKEKEALLNDSYMLIIILAFSIAISLSLTFMSFNGFWVKSLYYFALLGISYSTIFIMKPKYTGGKLAIALLIYTAVFAIIVLSIYFLYIRKKKIMQNESKNYKNLFK